MGNRSTSSIISATFFAGATVTCFSFPVQRDPSQFLLGAAARQQQQRTVSKQMIFDFMMC
jgi:hypothetical protein